MPRRTHFKNTNSFRCWVQDSFILKLKWIHRDQNQVLDELKYGTKRIQTVYDLFWNSFELTQEKNE